VSPAPRKICSRSYRLDLAREGERRLAERLLEWAVREDGQNLANCSVDGRPFRFDEDSGLLWARPGLAHKARSCSPIARAVGVQHAQRALLRRRLQPRSASRAKASWSSTISPSSRLRGFPSQGARTNSTSHLQRRGSQDLRSDGATLACLIGPLAPARRTGSLRLGFASSLPTMRTRGGPPPSRGLRPSPCKLPRSKSSSLLGSRCPSRGRWTSRQGTTSPSSPAGSTRRTSKCCSQIWCAALEVLADRAAHALSRYRAAGSRHHRHRASTIARGFALDECQL